MKRIIGFLLIFILVFGIFNTVSAEEVSIFLNSSQLNSDVAPVFVNDRILVPVRVIFEALGAEVSWDEENFVATGKRTGIEVKMPIDSNTYTRNGKEITLDVPATLIDGRTMVPVRAVAESFNCTVDWIEEFNAVSIVTEDLYVGAIADFPPFCYKDENGEIKGRDIELIVEIADRLNLSPYFTEYEFVEAFNAIDNERIYAVISGIAIDDNRTSTYGCSDPYYHSKQIIVSKDKIDNAKKLSGYNIGVLKGSTAESYVLLNVKEPLVKTYEDIDEMFKALKDGEIHCVIGEDKTLKDKIGGYRTNIFVEEDFGIYFDIEYTELKEEFNRVLGELKEEGKLDEIYKTVY